MTRTIGKWMTSGCRFGAQLGISDIGVRVSGRQRRERDDHDERQRPRAGIVEETFAADHIAGLGQTSGQIVERDLSFHVPPPFANPGATLGTATFGVISAAGDPRVVQLAAKFLF